MFSLFWVLFWSFSIRWPIVILNVFIYGIYFIKPLAHWCGVFETISYRQHNCQLYLLSVVSSCFHICYFFQQSKDIKISLLIFMVHIPCKFFLSAWMSLQFEVMNHTLYVIWTKINSKNKKCVSVCTIIVAVFFFFVMFR